MPAVVLAVRNPELAAARVVFAEAEIDAPAGAVFEAWRAQLGEAEVVAREDGALLTVQWPMPEALTALAARRTVLTLTCEARARGKTLFTLTHAGFGKGDAWDEALAYFAEGWPAVVAQMKAAIEERADAN